MKRFEELLDAVINWTFTQASEFVRFDEEALQNAEREQRAARLALVEYVRERIDSERHAVAAMLYLGGKLAQTTPCKGSPDWITEAIEATTALVCEVLP